MTEHAAMFDFYRQQSVASSPQHHAALFDGLPHDFAALLPVIQGIAVDVWDAERFGQALPTTSRDDDTIRSVAAMLDTLLARDPHPLTQARDPHVLLGANSRQFALLLCAMLRHWGIPARLRYGFATYFDPTFAYSHCICEYRAADRWVAVDAQLTTLARVVYHIGFDPADVPPTQFVNAAQAWQRATSGQSDPETFGFLPLFKARGIGVVRSQLLRDLATLNRVEVLAWDMWGLMEKAGRDLTDDNSALLERVAALIAVPDTDFEAMRALYESDTRLRVPDTNFISWPPATRTTLRGVAPDKRPNLAPYRPKRREFLKK